jgi:hypothetical protein
MRPSARWLLIIGLIACALVGAMISWVGQETSGTYRSVGVVASLAGAMSILALLRRSWSRLPLVVAAVLASGTAWDAFFGARDPSELSPLLGYFVSNVLLVALGAAAMAIAAWELANEHRGTSGRRY